MKLEANLTQWMWNELLLCGSIVRLGNKRKTKDSISRIIKKIVLWNAEKHFIYCLEIKPNENFNVNESQQKVNEW